MVQRVHGSSTPLLQQTLLTSKCLFVSHRLVVVHRQASCTCACSKAQVSAKPLDKQTFWAENGLASTGVVWPCMLTSTKTQIQKQIQICMFVGRGLSAGHFVLFWVNKKDNMYLHSWKLFAFKLFILGVLFIYHLEDAWERGDVVKAEDGQEHVGWGSHSLYSWGGHWGGVGE